MAFSPAVVGALTTVPVFLLARRALSDAASVGAAFLYAVIPVAVTYGRVGNPDHHVAVAHLGAWLLLGCVVLIERSLHGEPLRRAALGLAGVRLALLFTWHGSLLYLGLAESTIVLAVIASGQRRLAAAHALSVLATLGVFAAVLSTFPTPLLGDYSSIAPSRLHALALAGVVFVAGALWWATGRRPLAPAPLRFAWAAAASIAFVVAVLASPGPREGLVPAFQFLSMSDAVGSVTSEQFPLFPLFGRDPTRRAALVWGHLATVLPLLPIVALALARRAEHPVPWWALALWTGLLAPLSLIQIRYGNELAPLAAVVVAGAFAWCLGVARARLGLPTVVGAIASLLAGLALFEAPLRELYTPLAERAWARLREPEPAPVRSPAIALDLFLREVRAVTPETQGYLDPLRTPEYGVVSHANLGHAIQWVARRPTPTDPFWSYIGPENWRQAFGLLQSESESEALVHARALRARYVITIPGMNPGSVEARLHTHDGAASEDGPAFEHFRLLAEGPHGARTLHAAFARRSGGVPSDPIPYKLFEIVEGAVIEVGVEPGTRVELRKLLRSRAGRVFAYRSAAEAGPDGQARFRVPYAASLAGAEPDSSDEALYQLRSADRRWTASVREADVTSGALVRARPRLD
jgi:asparagine N-glycosylation enzyme membrane subunit Stt3